MRNILLIFLGFIVLSYQFEINNSENSDEISILLFSEGNMFNDNILGTDPISITIYCLLIFILLVATASSICCCVKKCKRRRNDNHYSRV